jgi:hypothetical protein
MKRQGLKRFLGKELQGSVSGRVVDMQIGFLFEPPPGSDLEVFEVLEVSSAKQVAFYVLKWRFNFPFGFWPAPSARNGLALIMRDKGGERGIEDRPSAFPSEYHGLFTIVETFLRYPTVILEGILMSSD